MAMPDETRGPRRGEAGTQGTACLSRARLADGCGSRPPGLPAGPPWSLGPRGAGERLLRRTAPALGVAEEDSPARPGEPKPAAERQSVGGGGPREATGHAPSAVLPFAAWPSIWVAGGRGGGEKRRAARACPLRGGPVHGRRRPADRPRSLSSSETAHDRAQCLRRDLVRELESSATPDGGATGQPLGLPGLQFGPPPAVPYLEPLWHGQEMPRIVGCTGSRHSH